jgi:type I restriction enzyme S subunit
MSELKGKKLKIDKSKWSLVKFGDVVFEPKESSKDHIVDGIEHVVGLEHIESANIHLRNSASIEEPTTFTKRFAVGDVLFGRRRAYLRKAAQACFEGICSGDITIFRAKENLLPELLPFIVSGENFFDYAIKYSAGGLSPRVKFKDLANYEFLLPPKDQQAELAKLLWAMDDVVEKEKNILKKLEVSKNSFKSKVLFKYSHSIEKNLPKDHSVLKLSEIAEISGGSTPLRSKSEYWGGEIPWLTPTDVTGHGRTNLKTTKECITDLGLGSISNKLYPVGSILYCSRATIGYAVLNDVPMSTNQGFSNFIVNEKSNNYFLYYLLLHLKPELIRLAGGSTFPEISKSSIKNFKVVIPAIEKQVKIANDLNVFETSRLEVVSKILRSQSLQKSLINEVF